MDTIFYYLSLMRPFFWWPVVFVGAWTLWRNRSWGALLVTLGSGIIGVMGALNTFFPHRAAFDADGVPMFEDPGLVSVDVQVHLSTLAAAFLAVGIILLLLRGEISRRNE